MKFCVECGCKLSEKFLEDEGMIPYCENCEDYRFEMFNSAVSTVIFNKAKNKVLFIQQYGRASNILVAGYINKGENAKEALIREVKEEVGLDVVDFTYNDSFYFDKSNTLIHNFMSIVDSEYFKIREQEVDAADWFTIEEATSAIKQGSLAESFVLQVFEKEQLI